MVAASWPRGTRSIRMSEMSRRMARVVSSTRTAKRKVQMGSAMLQRGSSCKDFWCSVRHHPLLAAPVSHTGSNRREHLFPPDEGPRDGHTNALDQVTDHMQHRAVEVDVLGLLLFFWTGHWEAVNLGQSLPFCCSPCCWVPVPSAV